jgi:hypothetical protein
MTLTLSITHYMIVPDGAPKISEYISPRLPKDLQYFDAIRHLGRLAPVRCINWQRTFARLDERRMPGSPNMRFEDYIPLYRAPLTEGGALHAFQRISSHLDPGAPDLLIEEHNELNGPMLGEVLSYEAYLMEYAVREVASVKMRVKLTPSINLVPPPLAQFLGCDWIVHAADVRAIYDTLPPGPAKQDFNRDFYDDRHPQRSVFKLDFSLT